MLKGQEGVRAVPRIAQAFRQVSLYDLPLERAAYVELCRRWRYAPRIYEYLAPVSGVTRGSKGGLGSDADCRVWWGAGSVRCNRIGINFVDWPADAERSPPYTPHGSIELGGRVRGGAAAAMTLC